MMDNNFNMDSYPKLGLLNTIVMAAISIASIREWIAIIAGMMAIISGFFAARHYYMQYKIGKEILNDSKKE